MLNYTIKKINGGKQNNYKLKNELFKESLQHFIENFTRGVTLMDTEI